MSMPDPGSFEFSDTAKAGWKSGRLASRVTATIADRVTDPSELASPPTAEPNLPILYVPPRLLEPVRLVVLLHGATSNPAAALPILRGHADAFGFLVYAPKSQGFTWDVIRRGFGPDVGALDTALHALFRRFPIDPEQISVAGVSDGATYALTLGLANGDLFRRIIAFSPGYTAELSRVGQPSVFVSHGTNDKVLLIDRTSRQIVPSLRAVGYEVDYREFVGGHEVPPEIALAAAETIAG